jgi:hypothetical protein
MTTPPRSPKPVPADETLPAARVVRWIALAGVILFSVALYFRFGLQTPSLSGAPAATTTSTP